MLSRNDICSSCLASPGGGTSTCTGDDRAVSSVEGRALARGRRRRQGMHAERGPGGRFSAVRLRAREMAGQRAGSCRRGCRARVVVRRGARARVGVGGRCRTQFARRPRSPAAVIGVGQPEILVVVANACMHAGHPTKSRRGGEGCAGPVGVLGCVQRWFHSTLCSATLGARGAATERELGRARGTRDVILRLRRRPAPRAASRRAERLRARARCARARRASAGAAGCEVRGTG